MILPKNFILINKPATWTSFDVVGYIRGAARRITKSKTIKIGHAGTLDPFATGLLIVGIGREATRELDQFKALTKTYQATLTLGATSDTLDSTGTITPSPTSQPPTEKAIRTVLAGFVGEQTQIPPMHSAKQVDGVRLYKLARQGKVVERQPNTITISSLTFVSYAWPELTISVTCSAGTYIRTLADDIGRQLGTGAYCSALTRTAIGPYTLDQAVSPDDSLAKLPDLL